MINETGGKKLNTLVDNIQTLLLNIFVVYFFFTFYFKFIERKTTQLKNEIIITLVSAVSIILCMSFPVLNFSGITLDFRQVPLIIGALYGGRRVAFVLVLVLLTYRFYLDISNFHIALFVYSLLLISLCFVVPHFKNTVNLQRKVKLAVLATLFGVGARMAMMLLFYSERPALDFLIAFTLILFLQLIGVVFFVVVNERTRRDALLSKEVMKLEKLRTVSELAASISHEVRNPLTVTRGFIQLVREPGLTDQEKNRYIETALEALDEAESTITDYLTFAKPSLENVEILDLHKELTYIEKFVKPYAAMNNVEIEVSLEESLYIAGEAKKFHQCLINIVKNGIEAMPQGGTLKIDMKRFEDSAMITITDTGIGMNEEQLERLGNPFFTTKDIGTGLGTMVVYSTVKAMDGEILVDSEPGKGTRFAVFIPSAEVI
ncbi:ATP-binding protein [Domibacillus sp. A3M-37]|uniref:ATP-binding protein n=1 Tax=Domibacillus sp. A3M-37 TaxID=2962037 RepID=UPI0020B8BFA4|nr:ATP-binding protein [Domibacillus sp. A3M-37]MCP3764055.1 ATP-binding protein [Domibacillus sp. A3M-37]